MTSRTIPQFAAIVAGAGLVLSSFAYAIPAGAQTTTTTTTTTTSATFTRDLTIGSTGADVTTLQNWLISKGFSIPAGATGYFGAQTQAALAAYQAANGITPAAGYFGPITRSKISTNGDVPVPSPTPSDDDEEDEDKQDAEQAIESVKEDLADARDDVQDAEDDGDDTDDAEGLLDQAENRVDAADEAFHDGEYDAVMGHVESAQDYIDEALDEIDSGRTGNNNDNEVSTSAEVNDRDGADNDIATFEITIGLEAFNQDAFVSRNPSVSFDYEIRDANGDAVSGATSESAVLQSSAGRDGNFYVINDGNEEDFTLTVTFDPLSADEGEHYQLQLIQVEFADDDSAPDQVWRARPESKYQTDFVYIAD